MFDWFDPAIHGGLIPKGIGRKVFSASDIQALQDDLDQRAEIGIQSHDPTESICKVDDHFRVKFTPNK